jgi:hypothetical protein
MTKTNHDKRRGTWFVFRPRWLVHAVDRSVWRVVDPTSLKRREGKIARGRSYVSLMYAGVGNGDDGMSRVWPK